MSKFFAFSLTIHTIAIIFTYLKYTTFFLIALGVFFIRWFIFASENIIFRGLSYKLMRISRSCAS